jgi:hypothetical protein
MYFANMQQMEKQSFHDNQVVWIEKVIVANLRPLLAMNALDDLRGDFLSGNSFEAFSRIVALKRVDHPRYSATKVDPSTRPSFPRTSILDHQSISGKYLFPQTRKLKNPFVVSVNEVLSGGYSRIVDESGLTMIYFHGNGETVADYMPFMADTFEVMELNSLLVEYRQYGGASGEAKFVAILADGESVMQAAVILPEKAVVFGRSMSSLYANELASRQLKAELQVVQFSEEATGSFSKRESQYDLSGELESVYWCRERVRRRSCTMTIR